MELTCITLWQPWASWIALGWKTIETRTHTGFSHLVGRRIGIHAGRRWDDDAIGLASRWLTLHDQHASEELRAVRGVLVGTAHVRGHYALNATHSQRALIDCGLTRRYGLLLDGIRPLVDPIPLTGHQGAWGWQVPDHTICRQCGCSGSNACVAGGVPCHWVGPDLCSCCSSENEEILRLGLKKGPMNPVSEPSTVTDLHQGSILNAGDTTGDHGAGM